MEQSGDSEPASFRAKSPEDRVQLVAINKEIAQCAMRKDIHGAKIAFERARRLGWANSHSYSAMINAHVRCGDIYSAVAVFDMLRTSRVKLDVVSCTTMIKGYCSVGDIGRAVGLLHEMKRRNLQPNIRTINTIIRGCVSTGNIKIGHNLFSCMKKVFEVQPDPSSWEYEVFMLCQSLQLDKALPMIGRIDGEGMGMLQSMSSIYGTIAKAAAVRGEWGSCKKYLKLCRDAIASDAAAITAANNDSDTDEFHEQEEASKSNARGRREGDKGGQPLLIQEAVGGKRAWKDMDVSRKKSLMVYREHKQAELTQELQMLEKYMAEKQRTGHGELADDLIFFERVLCFDVFRVGDPCESSQLPLLFLKNLIEKLGLDCFLQRRLGATSPLSSSNCSVLRDLLSLDDLSSLLFELDPNSAKKKKRKSGASSAPDEVTISSDAIFGDTVKSETVPDALEISNGQLKRIGRLLCSYVTTDGKLQFDSIFSGSQNIGAASLPVKLEICSGSGEWACQQALHDIGVANWVTLEIKQDRVYQTFLRMMFQGVRNLCAISGDAMRIIPENIKSDSIRNVFVNHPEPPVQYGGSFAKDAAEGVRPRKIFKSDGDASSTSDSHFCTYATDAYGKHLLTKEFFIEMQRILTPGGTITIVTDNLWYGKLLLRIFASMPHPRSLLSVPLDCSFRDQQMSPPSVQEEISGYILYRGRPGSACGHSSVEASSYFDRLWSLDKQPDRFFFHLQKTDGSCLNLRIKAKGNLSRMKNVPEIQQSKTFTVMKTGTKIRFDD